MHLKKKGQCNERTETNTTKKKEESVSLYNTKDHLVFSLSVCGAGFLRFDVIPNERGKCRTSSENTQLRLDLVVHIDISIYYSVLQEQTDKNDAFYWNVVQCAKQNNIISQEGSNHCYYCCCSNNEKGSDSE